jgi:hypothetical protein
MLINKFAIVAKPSFVLGSGNFQIANECRAIKIRCDAAERSVRVLNFEAETQLAEWGVE